MSIQPENTVIVSAGNANQPSAAPGKKVHISFAEARNQWWRDKHTIVAVQDAAGDQPHGWKHALLGCCCPFSLFCEAFWCPCVVFGRTSHRVHHENMDGYKPWNNLSCWICLASSTFCCFGIPQTIQYAQVRREYHLKGNGLKDCYTSFCCPLPGLIRAEKESKYSEDQHGQLPPEPVTLVHQQPPSNGVELMDMTLKGPSTTNSRRPTPTGTNPPSTNSASSVQNPPTPPASVPPPVSPQASTLDPYAWPPKSPPPQTI
ncbi:uncharacterized protein BDR25DRAFT_311149 [Lindgomyces ingoldianus]|uniref:Uncharacterized protein n=1 Tax=Lindgomyces ingoldianus TaxID=673940 RepID=A0ACB6R8R2_9PLEO|nr:uncharacterized protein BDR25DRAFT_311149 [Lindgomyces ingoldianus]KAF2474712.1 hypothetical protein BDR25DRAFT_311149 [Lindgomyces ingoldianus]